jgi:ferredoxin
LDAVILGHYLLSITPERFLTGSGVKPGHQPPDILGDRKAGVEWCSPRRILPNLDRSSRFCSLWAMTYVIAGSCIKDDSCIEVCPVDCIHPKPGDPDFETAEQLYIDPAVCIDCDACVEACPVDAIFAEFEVPEKFTYALDLNSEFFAERSTVERTAA